MLYAIKTFLSEVTVALLDDDKYPFTFYRIRSEDVNLGDLYLCRITQKMPEIKGYFAEIDHKRNLFLSTKHDLEIGQLVSVVISKEERLGKIAQAKRYGRPDSAKAPLGLLQKGDILAGIPDTTDYMQTDWTEEMDDMLSDSIEMVVPFGDSARLIFEQTHAFHSIDVDSASSQMPIEKLNELASVRIGQEIIRRNLSGNILIDFIGNKRKNDVATWKNIMSRELCKSPVPYQLIGVSPLGNVELRRDRMRMSSLDATRTVSAISYDLFKEILKEPARIKSVRVSLAIYAALTGILSKTWEQVQAKTGKAIPLSAATNLTTFEVDYTR